MMVKESEQNSMLLLGVFLSKTIETIDKLEDIEYTEIVNSDVIVKANAILNQIYVDYDKRNYRSAIRKCVFLKKYIEREMRSSDEGRQG